MPVCQLCSSPFPNRMVIDGKVRVLNGRKLCLTCSPRGLHNTRSAKVIRTTGLDIVTLRQDIPEGYGRCGLCLQIHPLGHFYLKGNQRYSYCKDCDNQRATQRAQALKMEAIRYKGGCCTICGYSACVAALVFHHTDPGLKDYTISRSTRTFKSAQAELDKCVLLCNRCHAEIHAGITTLYR